MNRQTWRPVLYGAAVGIGMTAFVAIAWQALYRGHPWPGYQRADAADLIPHQYTSSPLALTHVMIIYTVTGLLVGLLCTDLRAVLLSWIGLWSSVLLLFALSPAAWKSNLAPLAVFLFAIQAVPFLVTAAAGYGLRTVVKRRRR